MNIQKVSFYQNQTKIYVNKNKLALSFKGRDTFEAKKQEEKPILYKGYKQDEMLGDFCFENKDYDASIFYYESAIKKLKTYFKGDIKEAIKNVRKDSIKFSSYAKEYEKYREDMEKYNSAFFLLRLCKEVPKKPKSPNVDYDLALFNKNVVILSNLYNKFAMAHYAMGEQDKADEYLKKSKEVLKQVFK